MNPRFDVLPVLVVRSVKKHIRTDDVFNQMEFQNDA